jgi:glycosyltransferase involved in cell wall biosynthesis
MIVDLLVLTLNEIDGIRNIMPHVKKEWVNRIIIVDGGSTDGTIEEATKMGFEIIQQEGKGHGDAFLSGIHASNADYFIMWAPDGNFEPEEIPKLVEKIHEGFEQVSISRFAKNSINDDAGFWDTFGNKLFAFLTNVLFGGNFTDTLNGSRIISRSLMDKIKFNALEMNSTQQMTARGLKLNAKMCEIEGNERKRIGGVRKMKPISVGASISLTIIKEFIFWKK